MIIAFYVPNIDFYNKIVPFLKEKHFSWDGGVSSLIVPKEKSFYLYLSYMGYLYKYKDFESISRCGSYIHMRFFPYESNVNFL